MQPFALTTPLFLQKAATGKLTKGKVHISASDPVTFAKPSPLDLTLAVDTVQERQMRHTHVSYYHVTALAKVLALDKEIVFDALRELGCPFWPGQDDVGHRVPVDLDELWTVALQIGPWLAPLLHASHPLWSKWLWRLCETCVDEDTFGHPAVATVTESLLNRLVNATRCVDNAISELSQKGFTSPSAEHVVQIASKNGCSPRLLLKASVSLKFENAHAVMEKGKSTATDLLGDIWMRTDAPVWSDEALGYWGFRETLFVVQADQSGKPCVTLTGDRYKLRNKCLDKLIPFFEKETGLKVDLIGEAFTERQIRREHISNLSTDDISCLRQSVSRVSVAPSDRLRSGTGHSQQDIFVVRNSERIRVPEAVVWPTSEAQVKSVITLAKDRHWCLIPVGGGTNVTLATRCPPIETEPRPIISVDMKDMARILSMDEENGIAHVEAGITGRRLVEELGRIGYTLGHEPDSYEFSTLGGWIATKASGMKRNKYGNIEDIVKAVRVAGSDGLLVHGTEAYPVWGRESAGLDLCSLMLGSEGCLGVITSAVIRVWPIPQVKDHDSILLSDFRQGLAFVRDISKLGPLAPASVRLLDNAHFRLGRAMQPQDNSTWCLVRNSVGAMLLHCQGSYDENFVVCVTVQFEGSKQQVYEQKRQLRSVAHRHGGFHLGSSAGQHGYEMTFMIAYLRDFALTYHFLGESFESFVPWSKAEQAVDATKDRIDKEHRERCLPGRAFVGCRVTQLYHEGVCLYFYLCMSFDNVPNPSVVFAELEHAAREEVLRHGGSVSHHHGVGKVRATCLRGLDSVPWQDAKLAVKRALDPNNVFGARNGPFASYSTYNSEQMELDQLEH